MFELCFHGSSNGIRVSLICTRVRLVSLQPCPFNFRCRNAVKWWRWLTRGRLSPSCSLPTASFPSICQSTLPSKENINRSICSLVTSTVILPNQIRTNWKCRVSKSLLYQGRTPSHRAAHMNANTENTPRLLRQSGALERLPVNSALKKFIKVDFSLKKRSVILNSVLSTLNGLCLTLEILSSFDRTVLTKQKIHFLPATANNWIPKKRQQTQRLIKKKKKGKAVQWTHGLFY